MTVQATIISRLNMPHPPGDYFRFARGRCGFSMAFQAGASPEFLLSSLFAVIANWPIISSSTIADLVSLNRTYLLR